MHSSILHRFLIRGPVPTGAEIGPFFEDVRMPDIVYDLVLVSYSLWGGRKYDCPVAFAVWRSYQGRPIQLVQRYLPSSGLCLLDLR